MGGSQDELAMVSGRPTGVAGEPSAGAAPRARRGSRAWPGQLVSYILTVFALVTLAFMLPRAMPGDPLSAQMEGASPAYLQDPEVRAAQAAYYGLDQPLVVQYGRYLRGLTHGDMGTSILYGGTPVTTLVGDRVPWTLLLMGTAISLAVALGILAGVHSGWNRARPVDRRLLVAFVGVRSVPVFVLASLAFFLLCGRLGWFPLGGSSTVFADFGLARSLVDVAYHLVVPALVMAIEFAAGYFLLMRAGMVSQLGEDYLLMGRAKGVPERVLKYRYAMRNALLPVVTLTGLQLGFAITGAIFVETVFNYKGMGLLVVDAVNARDYPTLQGCFLLISITVVTVGFASDLLYRRLDPRTNPWAS